MIYQIASIPQRETQGVSETNLGLIQVRRIQAKVRARDIKAIFQNKCWFRNSLDSVVSRAG
jgi:hypothetical protein